jgi:PPOX class probable F420-dependent enzyme
MADERQIAELADGPYPCILTTLREDGSPYGVVVWCGREGDRFTINSDETNRWLENVRRDPRVSMVIVDTDNILRHVGIDGRVVSIEPDDDYAHIDSLSQTYMGREYAWARPGDIAKLKLTIEPVRVRTADIAVPD